MNRKLVLGLMLWSFLGVVIYLSFKLRNDEVDEIKSNHYKVIGVITNVGIKTIDISYTVNGIGYTYSQGKPYANLVQGEAFYTLVSKRNLDRALVYYTQPVIDTVRCNYKLVAANSIEKPWFNSSELIFRYSAGGQVYLRIQEYEDGLRPDNLVKLKVKYQVAHPEIGYLVAEK